MKKRIFLLLTTLMACISISQGATFVNDIIVGKVQYKLFSDNTATVVPRNISIVVSGQNYYCNRFHIGGDIVIQDEVTYWHNNQRYKVTKIGQSAFSGDSITSVVICKNVSTIESGAFAGCPNLQSVTFLTERNINCGLDAFNSSSLQEIHVVSIKAWCESFLGGGNSEYHIHPMTYAQHFYLNDEEVTNLAIPEGVEYINYEAFMNCPYITSIQIPSTCKTIKERAFKGCTGLQTLTFTPGVTSIEEEAFSGCNHYMFKTLDIPTTLQSIGKDAFMTCRMTKLIWNAKNCTGPSTDNTFARSNHNYNNEAEYNTTLEHITFGEQVVSLPDIFTNIGMDTILFKSVNPPSNICFGKRSGNNDTRFAYKYIQVPCGSKEAYKTAITGTGDLTKTLKDRIKEEPAPYNITLSCNKQQGSVSRTGASCELTFDISATPKSNYYFLQWSDGYTDNPRTITLTQDTIFTAEFAKQGCHIITFTNWDGKILQKLTDVEPGALPTYTASTPSRPSDSQYVYTFNGWSPQIVPATADVTYTAQYQAFEKCQEDPVAEEMLMFVSSQDGSTIGLASLASHQIIWYSIDGSTWNNLSMETTIQLNNGDSVYLRGMLTDNNTSTDYTQFTMTGAIATYGNINYLWNYQNVEMALKEYCGANLFRECVGLISAPELPSTELADYCYIGMFRGCSSLNLAPVLPAMTLTDHCYCSMFRECTSLTSAPSLPATTLATSCYTNMFHDCSNLTSAPTILPAITLADYCYQSLFNNTAISTAPELPATVLAYSCYNSMFRNCVNLQSAPSLPATILYNNCYQNMFTDCSALTYIKCLATDISATGCTQGWVNGVASSGTFVKNSEMTSWTIGKNGIPNGWTTQIETPTLIEINNTFSMHCIRKILRNGQILILRGDRTYTLTGQEVK